MKISKMISMLFVVLITAVLVFSMGRTALAEETETGAEVVTEEKEDSSVGTKAIAAAVCVGLAAAAGAIGMAMAVSKSAESMARQPEAADRINSTMMLGLVFIETAIIYALIVAILVIFVL